MEAKTAMIILEFGCIKIFRVAAEARVQLFRVYAYGKNGMAMVYWKDIFDAELLSK